MRDDKKAPWNTGNGRNSHQALRQNRGTHNAGGSKHHLRPRRGDRTHNRQPPQDARVE